MKHEYATDANTETLLARSKLPPALHLAEALERTMQWPLHGKAADLLREQHSAIERKDALLKQALAVMQLNLYGRSFQDFFDARNAAVDAITKELQ